MKLFVLLFLLAINTKMLTAQSQTESDSIFRLELAHDAQLIVDTYPGNQLGTSSLIPFLKLMRSSTNATVWIPKELGRYMTEVKKLSVQLNHTPSLTQKNYYYTPVFYKWLFSQFPKLPPLIARGDLLLSK